MERPTTERTATANPIEVISVPHRVSDLDLDLNAGASAKALEQRVSDSAKAAREVIERLERLANPAPGNPPCEKTAIDKGMAHGHAAVAAAQKGTERQRRAAAGGEVRHRRQARRAAVRRAVSVSRRGPWKSALCPAGAKA